MRDPLMVLKTQRLSCASTSFNRWLAVPDPCRRAKKLQRELIYDRFPPVCIDRRSRPHATNLFHGPLGTAILRTDDENYALHRPERMLHHEPLHLAIVSPPPVGAGKEGPADLNDAALRVLTVKALRSDDVAVRPIKCHQCATGCEGLPEESSEGCFLIAIFVLDAAPI